MAEEDIIMSCKKKMLYYLMWFLIISESIDYNLRI